MAEKIRGVNVLWWGKDQVGISTEGECSQNEDMYPEKVEMVVDLTQEAVEAFSLGDDRGIQRRHRGVFRPSECGESGSPGGARLAVAGGGILLPCPNEVTLLS